MSQQSDPSFIRLCVFVFLYCQKSPCVSSWVFCCIFVLELCLFVVVVLTLVFIKSLCPFVIVLCLPCVPLCDRVVPVCVCVGFVIFLFFLCLLFVAPVCVCVLLFVCLYLGQSAGCESLSVGVCLFINQQQKLFSQTAF